MKRLIIFLLLFAAIKVAGQTTGYLRFDTVKILKQNGTSELYIINATKDSLGLLTNVGGGLTRFVRPRVINDSTLVVGRDTLVIKGGAGGSGGGSGITDLTGDVTGTGPGSTATTISANAVTDAKFRQSAALSVVGRSANSIGNVADIAAATDNQVLRRSGTAIGFGAINIASSDAVTGVLPPANGGVDSNTYATQYDVDTAVNNLRTAKWPAESTFGNIYYKTQWSNFTDFSINTSGGATTALALSSGYINYTVSTIDWDNYTTVLPYRPTILNRWKIECIFQMNTTPAATTTGFGLTLHRAIAQNNDIACYINTTSGGSSGLLTIARGDGSATYTTQATTAVSVNDRIYLSLEMINDSTVRFSSLNITDGTSLTSATFSFPIGSSTQRIPTIGNWGFIGHSGVSCTWQVQSLRITSAATKNANGYVFGDSKSQFNTPTSFQHRTANRLNTVYPTFETYAAGGATINDFLNLQEEWTSLNGRQYLIHLGSNDKRGGATDQQVIDRAIALDAKLTGGGSKVCWTLGPEDSTAGGVGLTAIKNGMAATFGTRWINIWDTLSTSNVLQAGFNAGDGVHWNQAAIDAAHVRIVNSGCLTTAPTNRLTIYAKSDPNVKINGDSVSLMPIEKAPNYVNYYDSKGSSIPGVIQQTNTQSGTSPLGPISYITSVLFQTVGINAVSGTTGGYSYTDRSGSQTALAFSTYVDNGTWRVFNNTTATDRLTVSAAGLTSIGRGATAATSWLHIAANTASVGAIELTPSGAVLLGTPRTGVLEVNTSGQLAYTAVGGNRRWLAYSATATAAAGSILQGNGTDFTHLALGTANQQLRVNAGATALEYFTPSSGTNIYTADGSLSALRTVTLGNFNLVFDGTGTGKPVFNVGSDANGDMYYRASGVLSRLGIGGANTIMTSSGSAPQWSSAASLRTLLELDANTFTPTFTNVANTDAITLQEAQFVRNGSEVIAYITVNVDITAGATLTQFGISLPVASNFGNVLDACGFISSRSPTYETTGEIVADATNDRVQVSFTSGAGTGSGTFRLHFMYKIL